MGTPTTFSSALRTYPDDTELRGHPWRTGTDRIDSLEGVAGSTGPRGPGATPKETAERLRQCGERKDLDGVVSMFSEDAEFFMPVTDLVRLQGRTEIKNLLGSVFEGADFLRFHQDFGEGDNRLVVYHAVVKGRYYEEALWLRFNPNAEIREAVTFVRPLSGILQLGAAVGPQLIRRNGRSRAAAGSAGGLRVLSWVWSVVDRVFLARLVAPPRLRK